MRHFAVGYIGLPWRALGRDVQGFDCYGLFKHVQHLYFGVDVAEIGLDPSVDVIGMVRAFKSHAEFGHWREVVEPCEGDAVMMGNGRSVSHIGIYLAVDGGGVLHCDDIGGVQFTKHGEFGGHGHNYEILKYLRHKTK